MPHRRIRRALTTLLAFVMASALLTFGASPAWAALLVSDSFARSGSLPPDWGRASSTMGDYAYVNNTTANAFRIVGAVNDATSDGVIRAPAAGDFREANLPGGPEGVSWSRNTEVFTIFQFGAMPTGGAIAVGIPVRAAANGTNYLATASVNPGGTVSYGFRRWYLDGTGALVTSQLGTWQSKTGFTADTPWKIRIQAEGTSPTASALRMKLWKGSAAEPGSYAYTASDSTVMLRDEGFPGLRITRGANATNAPDIFFESFRVDDIGPPLPTLDVCGGSGNWQAAASVTLTPCDVVLNGSPGIDHYEYRTWRAGITTGPTTGSSAVITAEGTTVVQFRAVDVDGNPSGWYPRFYSAEKKNEVMLDHSVPIGIQVFGGSSSARNVSSIKISACCAEDVWSGVNTASYEYRTSTNDGASWSAASSGSSVTIGANGKTIVQFRVADQVGNVSAWTPSTPTGGSTAWIDTSLPPEIGTTYPWSGPGNTISTNTTWTKAGSPYILGCCGSGGPIHVAAGVTLTIEPGVKVVGYGSLSALDVDGRLLALGTQLEPIVFTSMADHTTGNGAPGQWVSIQLNGDDSVLQWVHVFYGGGSVSTSSEGNVRTIGSNIVIESSHIAASKNTGIRINDGDVTVRHTTVGNNGASGIFVNNATVHVEANSHVINNTDAGIYFSLDGVTQGGHLEHSTITGNVNHGVTIDLPSSASTGPDGQFNNIYGNSGSSNEEQLSGNLNDIALDWTHNYWGDHGIPLPCALPGGSPPWFGEYHDLVNVVGVLVDTLWDVALGEVIDVPVPNPISVPGDWDATADDPGLTPVGFPDPTNQNCEADRVLNNPWEDGKLNNSGF